MLICLQILFQFCSILLIPCIPEDDGGTAGEAFADYSFLKLHTYYILYIYITIGAGLGAIPMTSPVGGFPNPPLGIAISVQWG